MPPFVWLWEVQLHEVSSHRSEHHLAWGPIERVWKGEQGIVIRAAAQKTISNNSPTISCHDVDTSRPESLEMSPGAIQCSNVFQTYISPGNHMLMHDYRAASQNRECLSKVMDHTSHVPAICSSCRVITEGS